jgi:hypothetical protein
VSSEENENINHIFFDDGSRPVDLVHDVDEPQNRGDGIKREKKEIANCIQGWNTHSRVPIHPPEDIDGEHPDTGDENQAENTGREHPAFARFQVCEKQDEQNADAD